MTVPNVDSINHLDFSFRPRCECVLCDTGCTEAAALWLCAHKVDDCFPTAEEPSEEWSGYVCTACYSQYEQGVRRFLHRVSKMRTHCLTCGGPLRDLHDVIKQVRRLP